MKTIQAVINNEIYSGHNSKMTRFVIDGEHLLLLQNENSYECTSEFINLKSLADIINVNGDLLSFWVTELSQKLWIATSSLYYLAYTIQSRFPRSKINWKATMYKVEKDRYILKKAMQLAKKDKNFVEQPFNAMLESDRLNFQMQALEISLQPETLLLLTNKMNLSFTKHRMYI